MDNTNDRRSELEKEAKPAPSQAVTVETRPARPTMQGDHAAPPHQGGAAPTTSLHTAASVPPTARPASHSLRKWLLLVVVVVGLAAGGYFLVPWVRTALNTISTDDAYVNGHVTFVAPRVGG